MPAFDSRPTGIVGGPDGAVWFTEFGNNKIGRITAPSISNAVVAAVLPASRSIVVGGTATAFATIVNSTGSTLNGCTITPLTPVPAGFLYQTTNPRTNALTGTPNTPVSIGANASQSFLIALTATATQTPTQVTFGFNCGGAPAAAITTGVDTLLYSASSSAVPDIVALAATVQNDGILHITGTNGSNAFAVASVNVGASGAITVSANTGSATLPLNLMLCQTNPTSGQCFGAARRLGIDNDQRECHAHFRDFRNGERRDRLFAGDQPHLRAVQGRQRRRARRHQRRRADAVIPEARQNPLRLRTRGSAPSTMRRMVLLPCNPNETG